MIHGVKRASVDVRLIAIVDPDVLGARDLVTAARDAVAGGATAIQLRMKRAPAGTMCRVASELVRAVSVPVYVNDRADVAWAAGANGVHVGPDDLPAAELRAIAPRPFLIGVSLGTEGEAEAVRGADVDYWSIGSLFRTATKPDAGEPIGLEGLQSLARLAPRGVPVVGIGGIDASNAAAVIGAGASGVAVISAVFAAADVVRATRQIRDAVDGALH
jgi:thiamine-phosphate pyrophosphorylase